MGGKRGLSGLGRALGVALVVLASAGAASAEPKRIVFAGDSMADGLWNGFLRLTIRDQCLREELDLKREAKISTGLTRPDKFSWPEQVRRLGASLKPHVFVISLGLNDRQSVIDPEDGRGEWGTPAWAAKYREQIVRVLNAALASGAEVVWVGLPSMRDGVTDTDAREKNQLFAAALAAFNDPRARYVEPWRLKEPDAFSSYGPDITGSLVQIRNPDGIHFTPMGYELVATYLLPKIVASFEHMGLPFNRCGR
jgi:uncharacterized protein